MLSKHKEIPINKEQQYNEDAIEWLGFFYRMWHFITNETSRQIVRIFPPLSGLRQWYTLHQLNDETIIETARKQYNIAQKNRRKYVYSQNKLESKYSEGYFTFLSKRILYKLTKRRLFQGLEYTFDESDYDFIDDNNQIGLKTRTIFHNGTISISDIYKEIDEKAKHYKTNVRTSIFFCFVFEESYCNDRESFTKDLEMIRKTYIPSERNFKYIYFYIDGDLYEINPSNDVNITVIPVGTKEREMVVREIKEWGLFEQ